MENRFYSCWNVSFGLLFMNFTNLLSNLAYKAPYFNVESQYNRTPKT